MTCFKYCDSSSLSSITVDWRDLFPNLLSQRPDVEVGLLVCSFCPRRNQYLQEKDHVLLFSVLRDHKLFIK